MPFSGNGISYSTAPDSRSVTQSTNKAFTQQPLHACIVGGDQRGEVADALLPGPISQPVQQLGAEPPALPFVDDGDGNLGSLRVFGMPDVASHAEATAIDRIQCAQRLVVVVVDLGEVTQLRRGQGGLAGQESQLA